MGKLGEEIACKYLQDKGLTIVEKNFKANYGEIDIIARDKEWLIFVEVKTRIGDSYGEPLEAVTRGKLREVIKTAEFYLLKKNLNTDYRIDVMAINLKEDQSVKDIDWLENVTNT